MLDFLYGAGFIRIFRGVDWEGFKFFFRWGKFGICGVSVSRAKSRIERRFWDVTLVSSAVIS